jgi:hypothetical protein
MRPRKTAAPVLGIIATVMLTASCGGSTTAVMLHGDPSGYLITLGQLPSPDFTVYEAAAPVDAGWLDHDSSTAVRKDGWVRAAEVQYYRRVSYDTSNGPITVTAAVASFTSSGGAAAALTRLGAALDARSGAVPVSTGPLGDGEHAITVQGMLDGVQAVEFVMVWRVDNLLNSLVAQGRLGGLQLNQLLPLATIQTTNERRD